MGRYNYYKPLSLDDALALHDKIPGALFIAGGTDVMVKIVNGDIEPSALISLRSIPELSGIKENGSTRIGSMTTISELIEHPKLHKRYPVLIEAARRHSGPQIRNVATIGGNLCNCSPCADTATPLLVLDAKVRLRSIEGSREIPIEEFFKGPGETCLSSSEILTDILLDPPQREARAVFMKKGRVHMDLATASVAVLLEMEKNTCRRARLAAGSVAPVPLRLSQVEELLEGNIISSELLDRAREISSETVSPITDIRATEEYRRRIVGIYVRRGIERLLKK
ncbi:MAG: xanthine dehydrogenase family protein subunit M [bacterium]|nr:MAG: xanthine dehydrogenase family protein subunit M [bacterium]